ncbi:MAG: zinc ribbon domain-containing protein [Planctomycetota bacterium]
MPIYEYKCGGCERTFEELVLSEAAARKVACPHCGGRRVERVPSVFAAHAAPDRSPSRPPACQGCAGAGGCPMAGQ